MMMMDPYAYPPRWFSLYFFYHYHFKPHSRLVRLVLCSFSCFFPLDYYNKQKSWKFLLFLIDAFPSCTVTFFLLLLLLLLCENVFLPSRSGSCECLNVYDVNFSSYPHSSEKKLFLTIKKNYDAVWLGYWRKFTLKEHFISLFCFNVFIFFCFMCVMMMI